MDCFGKRAIQRFISQGRFNCIAVSNQFNALQFETVIGIDLLTKSLTKIAYENYFFLKL